MPELLKTRIRRHGRTPGNERIGIPVLGGTRFGKDLREPEHRVSEPCLNKKDGESFPALSKINHPKYDLLMIRRCGSKSHILTEGNFLARVSIFRS